jgi:uncharacterized protein
MMLAARIVDISIAAAAARMDAWLGQPVARVIDPSTGHWNRLGELLRQTQCAGNLIQDAHLASLAMEYGGTLCSTDADFSRFRGLNWRNPLPG